MAQRAERRRVLAVAATTIALPLALGAVALHARHARALRAGRDATTLAIVARLPSSDLALSGGSRWLRALSLEEPTAAFADAPAAPDPDPGGGALGAPRAAFVAEGLARAAAAASAAAPPSEDAPP